MVQWLGLCVLTARDRVQSLVGELRAHKSCSTAKKKREREVSNILMSTLSDAGSCQNTDLVQIIQ